MVPVVVDAFQTIPEDCAGGTGGAVADRMVAVLDRCAIDIAVIAPTAEDAAVHNRRGNDLVLAAVAAQPRHLSAMVSVNPWLGAEGCEELERCADLGACGLALNPLLYGLSLTDRRIQALIACAIARELPVYIHTGKAPYGEPLQFAALARRFPAGTFVMGHAGSTDYKRDVLPAARQSANIVIETSWASSLFLAEMTETLGAERLMFGSDYPLGSLPLEYVAQARTILDESARAAIFGGTATRVFGLAS